MHFEHLIEINDRDNPLVPDLTREELWFGLLCRAENPRPFLPGLDSCRIIERSDSELVRDHFGATVIRDKVTLVAMEWVRFESVATAQHAGGMLTITIEEPGNGDLFLRFEYRPRSPKPAATAASGFEYVKSAYPPVRYRDRTGDQDDRREFTPAIAPAGTPARHGPQRSGIDSQWGPKWKAKSRWKVEFSTAGDAWQWCASKCLRGLRGWEMARLWARTQDLGGLSAERLVMR